MNIHLITNYFDFIFKWSELAVKIQEYLDDSTIVMMNTMMNLT